MKALKQIPPKNRRKKLLGYILKGKIKNLKKTALVYQRDADKFAKTDSSFKLGYNDSQDPMGDAKDYLAKRKK